MQTCCRLAPSELGSRHGVGLSPYVDAFLPWLLLLALEMGFVSSESRDQTMLVFFINDSLNGTAELSREEHSIKDAYHNA